jgi:hypothetical protein
MQREWKKLPDRDEFNASIREMLAQGPTRHTARKVVADGKVATR